MADARQNAKVAQRAAANCLPCCAAPPVSPACSSPSSRACRSPAPACCPTRRRSAPRSAPSTSPVPASPAPTSSTSPRIPLDNPGVGARVVDVGDQRRLYVSGIPGLSIYDVTNPELPLLLGHLPLPNWENEDVSVSADGSTVLVTEYTGTFYLHVLDTSNPAVPAAGPPASCSTRAVTPASASTAACDWVYGSEGQIIDLRDKANPIVQPEQWTDLLGLPDGHAMTLDEAGILTIDTTPLAMVDAVRPAAPGAAGDGARRRSQDEAQTAYQHNNLRPARRPATGAARHAARARSAAAS